MEVRMNRWMRMSPLVILVMVAACAGGRAVEGPTDLNALSDRQIAHYDNALQAVETMRSQWLRGRSPGGLVTPGGSVRVYCDGMDVGGVEVLQSISTGGIAYIRYYNGIEASWRWGLGHDNGVIFVSNQQGLGPGARE
jgi:hypothetical protein